MNARLLSPEWDGGLLEIVVGSLVGALHVDPGTRQSVLLEEKVVHTFLFFYCESWMESESRTKMRRVTHVIGLRALARLVWKNVV
jgi:hypothetical protein